MQSFHVAVIPVGKVDREELEAVLTRAARVLRGPLELRDSLPVPKAAEDVERRQFRAATLMNHLRSMLAQLGPGKLVGSSPEGDAPAKPPPKPDAVVFVTDVDLFTANSDGVFAALVSSKKLGVVSVRRLREAFYRRSADPAKQRTRVVKEFARIAARLKGAAECVDPKCTLASSRHIADLDLKEERLCRACSQHLFEGRIKI